ncbi:MAG: sulfatase [Treponema sp.]|jgi:arylsulfatase A-like enzyme|nr:sulfatase [Treponema sp.]
MKAIMLMFDSLNRALLDPYGCTWTKTPNFKRLAEKTIRFDNCYAGSLPCIPARRELHTGRYNFLHRSWGPLEPFDDSMPELLRKNGVYSHLVTDHIHYFEDGGATYHNRYSSWEIIRGQEGDHWKVTPELLRNEAVPQNPEAVYFESTGNLHKHDMVNRKFFTGEEKTPLARTFTAGMEFMDLNHGESRWFLQIECFDPHEPFFSPEKYKSLYPDDYKGPLFDWPPYHHVTEDFTTVEHLRNSYAALLSMCDTWLGKFLDKMDEYQLWNDTMLIVNTDHGYLLGEHGWWSKIVMPCYDEIVHIPLFIHDPRYAKDGEFRTGLVQTIDLPATLLDYFNITIPANMQGKPLAPVIRDDMRIRDYALFGIHGAHVNITNGEYVYMKAPVSQDNSPLFEYTLMPAHMRRLFTTDDLQKATLAEPFGFTRNCPVLKIPKKSNFGNADFSFLLNDKQNSSRCIDNNDLLNAANFGDKLFDIRNDPHEEKKLYDIAAETCMANLLMRAMRENEAPDEQYKRIGLRKGHPVTEDDIRKIHEAAGKKQNLCILEEYDWDRSAVNTYKALLMFIPESEREMANSRIAAALTAVAGTERKIDCVMVNSVVHLVIPEQYRAMVSYFIGLAGRVA